MVGDIRSQTHLVHHDHENWENVERARQTEREMTKKKTKENGDICFTINFGPNFCFLYKKK